LNLFTSGLLLLTAVQYGLTATGHGAVADTFTEEVIGPGQEPVVLMYAEVGHIPTVAMRGVAGTGDKSI
jgi:hypothetical protein